MSNWPQPGGSSVLVLAFCHLQGPWRHRAPMHHPIHTQHNNIPSVNQCRWAQAEETTPTPLKAG